MKTNKIKPQKKAVKKAVKKHIEHNLTERFLEAVKGLGHNAELIAEDIAKLSKVAARKLAKKYREVKASVENKIDDTAISTRNLAVKKVKLAKKDASKLMKKVDKSVTKVVKKAVKKAKPVATSVKVEGIATAQKAKAAIKPSKNRAMATKSKTTSSANLPSGQEKKAVVKAVSNNPVKKVTTKAIPAKKNTTPKK